MNIVNKEGQLGVNTTRQNDHPNCKHSVDDSQNKHVQLSERENANRGYNHANTKRARYDEAVDQEDAPANRLDH